MDAFPAEINDQIIKLLGRDEYNKPQPKASYASVSRGFQFVVERHTFRSVKLPPCPVQGFDIQAFKTAFTIPRLTSTTDPASSAAHRARVVLARRQALRSIRVSPDPWKAGPKSAANSVRNLFSFLASWTDSSSRVSDRLHGRNDDLMVPGIELELSLYSHWLHAGTRWSNTDWGDPLPVVPIITTLVLFQTDYTEEQEHVLHTLRVLIQAFPNLKVLKWGYSDETVAAFCTLKRRKVSSLLAGGIASCIKASYLQNLTYLKLLDNHCFPYINFCEESHQEDYPRPEHELVVDKEEDRVVSALRLISRLPALETLVLENLAMANHMFKDNAEDLDTELWPSLRVLELSTNLANLSEKWDFLHPEPGDPATCCPPEDNVLVPFICTMARATLRMPKLERLEWTAEREAAKIRVECAAPWYRAKTAKRKLLNNEDPYHQRWDFELHGNFRDWQIPADIQTQLGKGNISVSKGNTKVQLMHMQGVWKGG
ncbi:hypothetical protein V8F20_002673 [Naviculisporaceae sp. PSN 640]